MRLYKQQRRGHDKELTRRHNLSCTCNPETHKPVMYKIHLHGEEFIYGKGHSIERTYVLEITPEDAAELEAWFARMRERKPPERFDLPAKR